MPITDTDEYIDYSSFNNDGGVSTGDTFNTWRKKTNGIINAIDGISITNIEPSQLSLGAPTWTTAGALSTYDNGTGTFRASSIIGTSLKVGGNSTTVASGAVNALELAVGTSNNEFKVTAAGAITGTSLNVGTGVINGGAITGASLNVTGTISSSSGGSININGAIIGASLKVGGSATTVVNGAVNALELAVGTTNNEFKVAATGAITGTSLKVGGSATTVASGAVNALTLAVGSSNTQFTVTNTGSITGASLNVGGGAIVCGTITASGSITANSFNSTSSLRYKKNIKPLENALDIISKLTGVRYDWKETEQSDIGLIAEHVNEVVPEFVLKDEEGIPMAVDYGRITSVLIQAINELSALVKQH
jgi:hypothetical protein